MSELGNDANQAIKQYATKAFGIAEKMYAKNKSQQKQYPMSDWQRKIAEKRQTAQSRVIGDVTQKKERVNDGHERF